jgi:hypothetical protein
VRQTDRDRNNRYSLQIESERQGIADGIERRIVIGLIDRRERHIDVSNQQRFPMFCRDPCSERSDTGY